MIEVSSQKTKSISRLSASTRPSMAAHEQQDEGQEPALLRMALQVAAGIEHDQRADAGDQQGKGQRQAVEEPGKGQVEARHPGVTAGHHFARGDFRHEADEMQEGKRREQRQQRGSGRAKPCG